ncbi:unnamed protein product, partial [Ectocarpus fasciculatus]
PTRPRVSRRFEPARRHHELPPAAGSVRRVLPEISLQRVFSVSPGCCGVQRRDRRRPRRRRCQRQRRRGEGGTNTHERVGGRDRHRERVHHGRCSLGDQHRQRHQARHHGAGQARSLRVA